MSKAGSKVRAYFRDTHTLLYSYLISLPLFALYEILITLSQPNDGYAVRVSVDIWIKTLLSYVSYDVVSITLIAVALFGLAILYIERSRLHTLRIRNFFYMLGEAMVYAFFIALLLGSLVTFLFQIASPHSINALSTVQKIALSLGAGLYEELFFRVLLVSGILFIIKPFTRNDAAFVIAVVLAASIFSAVHYLGPFADQFTVSSFTFRFLFGIALNILYLKRGFGVAAWTHAFYDIMVIVYS